MEEVEGHVWEPIELTWGQRLAAFWTIAWPAHVLTFCVGLVIAKFLGTNGRDQRAIWLSLAAAVLYLSSLPIFVPRMVRKRFRAFRIVVDRNGFAGDRLSVLEGLEVAIPILALQALFMIALNVIALLIRKNITAQGFQSLQTIMVWGRILLVGPYSVRLAIAFRYPRFRLQPYALKIAPPVDAA